MLSPPDPFDTDLLRDVLRRDWSVEAAELAYAALGFGSHHWITDDVFVTVDLSSERTRLDAALRTASALRNEAGLAFVVAPVPSTSGAVLADVGGEWVAHVYELLDVVGDPQFGEHTDPEVGDLVREVHRATDIAAPHARREDFGLDDRVELHHALADLDSTWEGGPYSERCRAVLAAHAAEVRTLLDVHDRLVAETSDSNWVLTHGEPHRGNVLRTTTGWAIVDWDTALVAPAERDLWQLPGSGGDERAKDLYRMRWDLGEVATYVAGFRSPHRGDLNDHEAWTNLQTYVELGQRWPELT